MVFRCFKKAWTFLLVLINVKHDCSSNFSKVTDHFNRKTKARLVELEMHHVFLTHSLDWLPFISCQFVFLFPWHSLAYYLYIKSSCSPFVILIIAECIHLSVLPATTPVELLSSCLSFTSYSVFTLCLLFSSCISLSLLNNCDVTALLNLQLQNDQCSRLFANKRGRRSVDFWKESCNKYNTWDQTLQQEEGWQETGWWMHRKIAYRLWIRQRNTKLTSDTNSKHTYNTMSQQRPHNATQNYLRWWSLWTSQPTRRRICFARQTRLWWNSWLSRCISESPDNDVKFLFQILRIFLMSSLSYYTCYHIISVKCHIMFSSTCYWH